MKKISIGQWQAILSFALLGLFTGCSTTISNLIPSSGTFGTEVTIEGGHLNNPISVDFSGVIVPPTGILSSTGTELKVLVPPGANTGRVHVDTPKGKGTSPYDFTVVSKKYTEQGPNDTFEEANPVDLNDHISGSLSSDDTDWFKIRSGPAEVWGYMLEFSAEALTMPPNFQLRMVLECDPQLAGGTLTTNDGNKTISWVTLPPNTDIYLMVSSVGSGTWSSNPDYTIHISRIPIKDKNEPNDSEQQATPISLSSGIGSENGSYLCNVFDPQASGYQYIGFKDYYRIQKPLDGQRIGVVILFAGLEGQNNMVYLELIDENQVLVTSTYGNSEAATLDYIVPSNTNATGDWFVLVSNPWHEDDASGNGPAPLSCKKPYSILVTIK